MPVICGKLAGVPAGAAVRPTRLFSLPIDDGELDDLRRRAETWLSPLYEAMKVYLLRQGALHADETTLQVLREPGKSADVITICGYNGPEAYRLRFCTSTKRQGAASISGTFCRDLRAICTWTAKVAKVKLVGCWAHARRKFDEALKGAPPETGKLSSVAGQRLAYCNQLYAIERELADVSPEERHAKRQKRSVPALGAYREWLRQQKSRTLPKV
ncbi:transposase [Cohnella sp. CBP 2801]|uniref:Transposase n=1 Tax=Cohnella zeiphila TaxID=2761120 RepID=A0A7X0SMR2_9BACL|nr:transposase [Cohnella zeiphila]